MAADIDIVVGADSSKAIAGLKQTDAAIKRLGEDAQRSFGKADKAAADFTRQTASMQRSLTQTSGAARAASANIASQFQDIAVSAQGGMSVLSIALQQGAQLGSVMASAGGGVRALGSAFASLFAPMNLFGIALAAGGALLVQFLTTANKVEPIDLDKTLANIADALERLKQAYPEAAIQGIHDIAVVTQQLARGNALIEQENAATALTAKLQELQQQYVGTFSAVPQGIDAAPITATVDAIIAKLQAGQGSAEEFANSFANMTGPDVTNEMIALGGVIGDITADAISAAGGVNELAAARLQFSMGLIQGKPDLIAYTDELARIAATNADAKVRDLAAQLLAALGPVRELAQQSGALAGGIATVGNAAAGATPLVLGLTAALRDMQAAASGFASAMASLDRIGAATLTDRAQAQADFNKAMAAAGSQLERQAAQQKFDAASLRITQRETEALEQQVNTVRDAIDPTRVYQRRIEELNDARAHGIKISEQELAALKHQIGLETGVIKPPTAGGGKGGGGVKAPAATIGGVDMSMTQLEQWSRSMQEALDPTMKLREETEKLDAAIAADKFPADQRAAALAKLTEQYGKSTAAAFDFQKTFASMMSSWGDQVASSFADAIVNGEDLGSVFQDLIKQLIKMALQMLVLKPLMDSFTGWAGSLGAPAAAAAAVPVAMNDNMMTRASAGLGRGGRNGQAGGGRNSTVLGGVVVNVNGLSGGTVQADSARGRALGQHLSDAIQTELVKQSRPGGLLWAGGRGQ